MADYGGVGGEDEYEEDNEDVLELINEVIKDIGLEGQMEPTEVIDWLIREEFPMYRERQFYVGKRDVSLEDVVNGFDEDEY